MAATIDVQRPTRAAVDEFLPVYDVSDAVAVLVAADPATTWRALLDADLIELGRRRPAVAALGALRALPDVLSRMRRGDKPRAPERMRLRDMPKLDMRDGGWVLLAERPGREIALGLVGKFWRPVIEFADVDAAHFAEFATPGYAKTIYALSLQPVDVDQTLLVAVMRTATTDECARSWFRRYWTFGVGSGAHVLAHGLIECVRDDAEQRMTQSDRAA